MADEITDNLGLTKIQLGVGTGNWGTKLNDNFQEIDDRFEPATPSTQAFGDAAAQGVATTVARSDHKHAMPAFPYSGSTPAAIVYGGSGTAGASTNVSRADHVHPIDAIAIVDASITVAKLAPATVAYFLPTGGGTMSGSIAMGSQKITGLAAGTANGDAVRYEQAVLSSGDQTITGVKTFSGQLIAKGQTSNTAPFAGYIGEVIESVISANVNLPANGVWGDLTSIALTAGNWMVCAHFRINASNATALTNYEMGISSTSGNSSTGLTGGDNRLERNRAAMAANEREIVTLVGYNVRLSSATTYYFKMSASYSGGQPVATGKISALRIS